MGFSLSQKYHTTRCDPVSPTTPFLRPRNIILQDATPFLRPDPVSPTPFLRTRDQPLEVEAFLENKDIGFVKAQQPAEVKIETFQYTKYGTLHAQVISVSHDAINDEKRGLIYSTRVKMDTTQINVDGTWVNLSPGMAVSVETPVPRD